MSSFEKEYYLLRSGGAESLPIPRAFHETEARDYRTTPVPPDSPPLAFFNFGKQRARRLGRQARPFPPDVMFEFDSMLVRKSVRDTLVEKGVSRIFTHPAWYVHDDKSLHDDYWYVGFTEKFDCWDRELSEYSEGGEYSRPDIDVLRFDAQLLAATPLNERLLFVLDDCVSLGVVCHESLLPLFHGTENSGTRATLVMDYGNPDSEE